MILRCGLESSSYIFPVVIARYMQSNVWNTFVKTQKTSQMTFCFHCSLLPQGWHILGGNDTKKKRLKWNLMLLFIANKKELTCHEEVLSNQIYVSKGLRVSYIYLSSTETGFPIYTWITHHLSHMKLLSIWFFLNQFSLRIP